MSEADQLSNMYVNRWVPVGWHRAASANGFSCLPPYSVSIPPEARMAWMGVPLAKSSRSTKLTWKSLPAAR